MKLLMTLFILTIIMAIPMAVSAHCDSVDGPTVTDAKKAIETNNANYVLKWITPDNEKEITHIFELAMKVRGLNSDAQELADQYFFQNLVRIHRAGEGAPYTGLKPSGTPVDEKILAADKSIEVGNLSPLEKMVPNDKMPELEERFEKVMALKNFDVNDVKAGREYIEAYVSFFHFAEGEEEHAAEAGHTVDGHAAETGHAAEAVHADEAVNTEDDHAAAASPTSSPKNGGSGIIPLVAVSVVAGLGVLALILFRKH